MVLSLKRKPKQKIVVEHGGESLVIWLDGIRPGQAQILFKGPESFRVVRAECLLDDDAVHRLEGFDGGTHEGQQWVQVPAIRTRPLLIPVAQIVEQGRRERGGRKAIWVEVKAAYAMMRGWIPEPKEGLEGLPLGRVGVGG